LAHNLATPCIGCEPKARVAIEELHRSMPLLEECELESCGNSNDFDT
jgi:hypothetical protein